MFHFCKILILGKFWPNLRKLRYFTKYIYAHNYRSLYQTPENPISGDCAFGAAARQRVRPQSPGWGWGVRVNNGLFRSDEFHRPTTSARLSGCFKQHSMQTGWLYTVYIGCHPRNIDKQACSSASEPTSAHLCSRSCLHERPPRPTPMFSVEGVGKRSRAPRPNFFYTSRASTNPNRTKHQKTPFPGTAPSAPRRAQRVRPQSPGCGWGLGLIMTEK